MDLTYFEWLPVLVLRENLLLAGVLFALMNIWTFQALRLHPDGKRKWIQAVFFAILATTVSLVWGILFAIAIYTVKK